MQFSLSVRFISIWPIEKTQLGATTPGQSGPWSDGNEGVLCIPQSSIIISALSSGCFVSYPEHSLRGSYPSAEKQSAYFSAPANSARPVRISELVSNEEAF